MTRRGRRRGLPAFFLLAPLAGCSIYLNRPVTFHVRDAETGQPIIGARVQVDYSRYVELGIPLTGPETTEGVTDRDGKLTLRVDPYKEHIHVTTTAIGYLDEEHRWGTWVAERLTLRKRFEWKNELLVEMYADPPGELDLVFPREFRGRVLVRFSSAVTPSPAPGVRRLRYEVPANGVVEIREGRLLERPVADDNLSAHWSDGTAIPFVTESSSPELADSKLLDEMIALRWIQPDWANHTWLLVLGTRRDADAVRAPDPSAPVRTGRREVAHAERVQASH